MMYQAGDLGLTIDFGINRAGSILRRKTNGQWKDGLIQAHFRTRVYTADKSLAFQTLIQIIRSVNHKRNFVRIERNRFAIFNHARRRLIHKLLHRRFDFPTVKYDDPAHQA